MNKKILTFAKILIFNLVETLIIFLLGKLLNVPISTRLMFMVLFFLTRMIAGKPKHYKKAYQCAIWSFLVFLSLYTLSTLELPVIILLTIFTAFITTGKADINDMFMWKRNELNERVLEWTRFNLDNELLMKYKNDLKQRDKRKYYIYVYYFEEHKSFETISQIMDIDRQRIGEEVAIMSHFIEYGIRLK